MEMRNLTVVRFRIFIYTKGDDGLEQFIFEGSLPSPKQNYEREDNRWKKKLKQ